MTNEEQANIDQALEDIYKSGIEMLKYIYNHKDVDVIKMPTDHFELLIGGFLYMFEERMHMRDIPPKEKMN